MEAGQDADTYWSQSPRTIRAVLDGYDKRCDWEHRLTLSGAWHAGMLGRVKDPPSLGEMLGEKRAEKSGDDLAAVAAAWERATGGSQ